MKLSPRYGTDPLLRLDGDPASIAEPLVGQRRRLLETVAKFGPDDWAHQSRCEDWSSRDVIHHLVSTNGFWELSLTAGMAGTPTTILADFDPAATPSLLIAGAPERSDQHLLDAFAASVESLATLVEAMSEADWTMLGESPPGHVSLSAVAHHALWDSWIHERDILLPLGQTVPTVAPEVEACIRYVAGLNPAFGVGSGRSAGGSFAVATTEPVVAAVIEAHDHVTVRAGADAGVTQVTGSTVELIDALSRRAPFTADIAADEQWMFDGLGTVFDQI